MNTANTNIEHTIINYLNNSITEQESRELRLWLETSEENKKIFLDYHTIWTFSQDMEFDGQKALERFMIEIQESDRRKKKKRKIILYRIAAAACIALIAAIPFLLNNSKDDILVFANSIPQADYNHPQTKLIISEEKILLLEDKDVSIRYESGNIQVSEENTISKEESSLFNQLITPFGKRSTIVFDDGTKAWINSGTRLVYPLEFRKDKREIYVDGEIYLEVTEDKERPFIVRSENMDVRVLGTRFNVSAYETDDIKKIVLVSGSVKVLPKDNSLKDVLLKPDQMYTVADGKSRIEPIDASKYILWKDGFYAFESVKLEEIFKQLSRYYKEEIICDEATSELRCSGKLDMKDDLKEVLKGLTHTAPITFEQIAEKKFSISSRQDKN